MEKAARIHAVLDAYKQKIDALPNLIFRDQQGPIQWRLNRAVSVR